MPDDHSFPEGFGPSFSTSVRPCPAPDWLRQAGAGSQLHPVLEVDAVASSCGRDLSGAREADAPRHCLASRRHPAVDREQGRHLIDKDNVANKDCY